MTSNNDIVIVSGLPRSGTSLMMQMLANGGMEVVTDQIRTADSDNPNGYFELEMVKDIQHDASWLPGTRGKAFKMISLLLYQLPANEQYRILFMERDLDEILQSQEIMLHRLNRPSVPRTQMRQAFQIHLEQFEQWTKSRPEMMFLKIQYRDLLTQPDLLAQKVCAFLERPLNVKEMASAVDVNLYRNRSTSGTFETEPDGHSMTEI